MPDLDPAAMHGPAGAWAQTATTFIEGSAVGVLVGTLVGFGNLVGRRPMTRIGALSHYVTEYALLAGPTATARKGDTMRIALHPLELSDPAWHRRVQGGFGSGEGLIWEVRDLDADADEFDQRLLVRQAEFASIIEVARRQGSVLSSVVREAWDGDRLQNRTKGAGQQVVSSNPHISILAGITPDELRRSVPASEVANGFLNRFLIVAVKRERLLSNPPTLTRDVVQPYATAFGELAAHARTVRRMTRTPAAAELWHQVYCHQLAVERPGLAGAVTSRAEAHTMRLSMIYALLDGSAVVDVQHVQAALALWLYCEASARLVFGTAVGNATADVILAALEERSPDPLTRSQVIELFGRHRSQADIDAALGELQRLGRVVITSEATGGRPRQLIYLADTQNQPASA